jgi:hypothetical protein
VDRGAYQQMVEHRRAVNRSLGGTLVLIELVFELNKVGDRRNRDVVLEANRFLASWVTASAESLCCFSVNRGLRLIRQALNGYLDDRDIATTAIGCFYNFISDEDATYLNEFVDGGSLQCMIRAMKLSCHTHNEILQYRALRVIDRLIVGEVPHGVLIAAGALDAVMAANEAFRDGTTELRLQLQLLCDKLLRTLYVPPPQE